MEVMSLQELAKRTGTEFTEDEKNILTKWDVVLKFPVSAEETSKIKAEALADIVYKNLGDENSRKLVEILENS